MAGPLLRLTLMWVPALTCACAGHFAPPARGDLDFAGSRVAPASPELALTTLSPDDGSGQLAYRHALTPRDTVEATALDHKVPGRRDAFAMAGVGYRRHLAPVDAALQPVLGFGTALGVGGQSLDWSDAVRHYPGALAGYLDLGVAWRASPVLTLYAAGRVSRTMAFHWRDADETNKESALPPVTDWVHGGGGVRIDVHPFFLTADLGMAAYSNRVKEDHGAVLNVGMGVRFGAPAPRVGHDCPQLGCAQPGLTEAAAAGTLARAVPVAPTATP